MNKAIFYMKKHENIIEFWAKLISGNNDVILDIKLSHNNDYGSVKDWKSHDLQFKDNCSEFTNELYHYYFMPIIYKFLCFQETHKVQQINFEGEHSDFYIAAGYFLEKKIKINHLKFFKLKYYFLYFKRIALYFKSQIISLSVIIFKAIRNAKTFSNKPDVKNEFALIHSKSSYRNIEKLKLELNYYYDDINLTQKPNKKAVSFYKMIRIVDYLKLIFKSFMLTHDIFKKLAASSKTMVGGFGAIHAMNFFSTRIGHYILIKQAYKNIFNYHSGVKFYSGERESRYGALAKDFSKIHKNYSIAIPHGMSYSYKYPLGLFGQKYYCTTLQESKYLNEIYNETKFIFDKDVMNIIYRVGLIESKNKKIVFFTEPRRIYVNIFIIENLIKILDQTLYIKLHPLEDVSFYKDYKNIKFINDFDRAIQSNICISRKSTILVEALYNQSIPIALLVDKQDEFDYNNTFPSLLDPEIYKCHSFKDLVYSIKKY